MPAQSTSIKLDPEMKDRVQALATSRKRTAHWLMKEAIEQYVTREEKRASFRRDAELAWEDYQKTGLHLTGDEVIAWLKTWGTPDEKPMPECHT
jgi:predicted transcriptional regulator